MYIPGGGRLNMSDSLITRSRSLLWTGTRRPGGRTRRGRRGSGRRRDWGKSYWRRSGGRRNVEKSEEETHIFNSPSPVIINTQNRTVGDNGCEYSFSNNLLTPSCRPSNYPSLVFMNCRITPLCHWQKIYFYQFYYNVYSPMSLLSDKVDITMNFHAAPTTCQIGPNQTWEVAGLTDWWTVLELKWRFSVLQFFLLQARYCGLGMRSMFQMIWTFECFRPLHNTYK